MIGDYIGPFEPGTLILTGPNLPHNWVSEIGPDVRVSQRDMLIQFTPEFGGAIGSTFAEFKERAERAYILAKLREHDWNVSETARAVDMPRSNLYKKIERYNLVREDA